MIELPEFYEIQEQWPTLAAMAVMEVLLSVDNLIAVSAVAAHLPPQKRKLALGIGAIGSYFLRVVALLVTAPLISSYAVAKILGSLYMIHLMASHFTSLKTESEAARQVEWSFGKTLAMVLLVDFILNTDNIVAAVSMSKQIWVVCSSVIFGIIFVRVLGRVTVRAVRRFPILSDSVYVLVGWIGVLLMAETVTKTLKISHLTDIQKFLALIEILLFTLIYDSMPALQRALSPLLQKFCLPVLRVINFPLSILFWPIRKLTAIAA
jgi:YkoY family integral membrane protein